MKLNHKKLASALVLLSFLSYMPLSSTMAFAAIDAGAMPSLNNAINGAVTTDGNRMDVTVQGGSGAVGQFDWNNFNVGSNGHVNFGFTNNHQTSLNRVLASGGLSQIYGKLTNSCANGDCSSYVGTGKVILINPNGIMFGNGSTVDLNSFTATTFDLYGAKNIKDMSADELAAYKAKINVKADGNPSDMVTTAYFTRDGVLKTTDGAGVTLEGTNFNIDKSLALAADNVAVYRDSLIRTNLDFNYGGGLNPSAHNQSFSNVRIVTGDGVVFGYRKNGNIYGHEVGKNDAATVTNNINIDGATIQSGKVVIENTGAKTGSDINIKNSIVKGYKLVNNEFGDILIKGANDVSITDSHLQTNNTFNEVKNVDTYSQNGGMVQISAGKNVNIKNSKVETAYSNKDFGKENVGQNAGDLAIAANGGNINIDNSNLHAKGDVQIAAAGKLDAKNSSIRAVNYSDHDASAATLLKKVNIGAANGNITLDNTFVDATANLTLSTPKNIDVKNNSVLYTPNKDINIYGANSTIADSTLVYNGLNFVNPNQDINNVTIKGSTTLQALNQEELKLTTNGNLTIDGNKLQKRGFSATDDDATMDIVVTLDPVQNQGKITLTSTGGKVTFKNNSNVQTATGDITVNANNAANGEIFVQSSTLASAGNINLNQAKTHTAGTHITKDSTLKGKNIKITTKNPDADINAAIDDFANLSYTERLALNAGRDNNITGTGNLNAKNVDFNAAQNNNINVTGNVTTDNSTLNGKVNNITASGNVTLKNTEVKAKTADTKTVINADNNFTTGDTVLKINGTKLIANADKETNITLQGANNENQGIEINAKYTSAELSDKTVTINAADNQLAISKIKAGNLNLDSNDTFIAALTNLTDADLAEGMNGITADASGRAYIEVANWGQFNLDPMDEHEIQFNDPASFDYTDHFVAGKRQPEAGNAISTYKKHFIKFGDNDTAEKFVLVYEKPFGECEAPDEVVPGGDDSFGFDSLISQLRLPRQLEPTSKTAPIANNTTDPTSGIVNAAAKIEVDENTTTTKDREEFEI